MTLELQHIFDGPSSMSNQTHTSLINNLTPVPFSPSLLPAIDSTLSISSIFSPRLTQSSHVTTTTNPASNINSISQNTASSALSITAPIAAHDLLSQICTTPLNLDTNSEVTQISGGTLSSDSSCPTISAKPQPLQAPVAISSSDNCYEDLIRDSSQRGSSNVHDSLSTSAHILDQNQTQYHHNHHNQYHNDQTNHYLQRTKVAQNLQVQPHQQQQDQQQQQQRQHHHYHQQQYQQQQQQQQQQKQHQQHQQHQQQDSSKSPNLSSSSSISTPATNKKRRTRPVGVTKRGRRISSNSTLPCPVCRQTYSRKDNLRAHMRVHSGEKPYKCTKCTEAFRWLGALRKHMAIHECEDSNSSCNSSVPSDLITDVATSKILPATSLSQTPSFKNEKKVIEASHQNVNIKDVSGQSMPLFELSEKCHDQVMNDYNFAESWTLPELTSNLLFVPPSS